MRNDLADAWAQGKLRMPIDRTYPLKRSWTRLRTCKPIGTLARLCSRMRSLAMDMIMAMEVESVNGSRRRACSPNLSL